MKKLFFIVSAAAMLTACNEAPKSKVATPSEIISETPAAKAPEKIDVYNKDGGFNTDGAKQVPIADMSATELSDLLQITVRPNRGITYNGYYSQEKIDGEAMLHGPFLVKSESPELADGKAGRSVFYKGIFFKGVRHDFWSERVRIAAAETKEDYNMTMNFNGGECGKIVFSGTLHENMKPEQIEYEGEAVCDFGIVRKKIYTDFQIKYKAELKK